MKIIVDADACPKNVLLICCQQGQTAGIPVYTVASCAHEIENEFHICVDNEPQAADLKIVNLARPGDIIVTQDWGLPAILLGKKAVCLSPTGSVYEPGKMDFLLEEREVKAKLRRNGKRTKGPRPRSLADDQRFAASLAQLLEQSI